METPFARKNKKGKIHIKYGLTSPLLSFFQNTWGLFKKNSQNPLIFLKEDCCGRAWESSVFLLLVPTCVDRHLKRPRAKGDPNSLLHICFGCVTLNPLLSLHRITRHKQVFTLARLGCVELVANPWHPPGKWTLYSHLHTAISLGKCRCVCVHKMWQILAMGYVMTEGGAGTLAEEECMFRASRW